VVQALDLILAGGTMARMAYAATVEPVLQAAQALVAASAINEKWATTLAWGIEARLLSAAEAHTAFGRSHDVAMKQLVDGFAARVAEIVQKGIGVDISGKTVDGVEQQWWANLADDAIYSQHYVTFEADRFHWLRPDVRRDWGNLLKHRMFCTVDPAGLWGQHEADINTALKAYDPTDAKKSYAHYCEEIALQLGEDEGDALFGNLDTYESVLNSLRSEPRPACLHAPDGYDAGGARSDAVQAYLAKVRRWLNRLERTAGCNYDLADDMGHPQEAVVILPAPGADIAADLYYQMRYEGNGELPGNVLGIEPGAGQRPIWRAVYAISASAIVLGLERLLEVRTA
jgi:hypothetical protein